MKALQANAISAVEQNRLPGSDNRRRPTRDRAPTRARARQHGLQVSIAEPPGRLEVGAVFDHGGGIPECSAHPYLHAIIGVGRPVPFAGREIARERGILHRHGRRIAH